MQPTAALRLSAPKVMGALVSLVAVGACSQASEGPIRSVGYYRSHAAEREQRLWGCTNEPPTFERSSDCVNALLALETRRRLESNKATASSLFPPVD